MMSQYMFLSRPAAAALCPNSRAGELYAVRALDSTHVWVVGGYDAFSDYHPFAARWGGPGWTQYELATTAHPSLIAVAGTAGKPLWAASVRPFGGDLDPNHSDYAYYQYLPGPNTWTAYGSEAGAALALVDTGDADPPGWAGYLINTVTSTRYLLAKAAGSTTWAAAPQSSSHTGVRHPFAGAAAGGEVWIGGSFQAVATTPYVERVAGSGSAADLFLDGTGIGNGEVRGLWAVAAGHLFACGYYSEDILGQHAAVWEYSGGAWVELPIPPIAAVHDGWFLYSIGGVAADDLWVVGSWTIPVDDDLIEHLYLAHWDGADWTEFFPDRPYASPVTDLHSGAHLNGVVLLSATDGWAVGRACDQMLVLRWNGTRWATVELPA